MFLFNNICYNIYVGETMEKKYKEDLEYFLNYVELKRGMELDKKYPN